MNFFATLLHLALLTTDQYPDSLKEDHLLIEALRSYEIEAESLDWQQQEKPWADFDAAIVYSCWDYIQDRKRFMSALKEIENQGVKVYNSPAVIEWNSSKKYLQDLENLGLKIVDTAFISPAELVALKDLLLEKGWNECVIKPQVSADAHDTYRFNLSNIEEIQKRFINFKEDLMIQPFAEEIMEEGEWSFVFFNGEYNHCILKKPMGEGNFLVQNGSIELVEPPDWMIERAQKIYDTIHISSLKTRVDLIRRGDELMIMEIEMIEPLLFLDKVPGSAKKLAQKMSEAIRKDTLPN